MIQLEDFATRNAFGLLERYRRRHCLFDDDIQGTAAVAVAGLYAASRLTGAEVTEGRYLFLGAGEAGIGIGQLLVAAMKDAGMPEQEARARCWYLDSKGLVTADRAQLASHKREFAQDHEPISDLLAAVRDLKPTALIGVSGQGGAFTEPVLKAMAELNERPLVFALSNPTSKSECTALEAYRHTEGRALFASGSPFDPVELGGTKFVPGQGNNAYVFPGIGLGLIASEARSVTDSMFLIAAKVLADEVKQDDLKLGRLYPDLVRVREVSARIAEAVATLAYDEDLARAPRPEDIPARIAELVFEPRYGALQGWKI